MYLNTSLGVGAYLKVKTAVDVIKMYNLNSHMCGVTLTQHLHTQHTQRWSFGALCRPSSFEGILVVTWAAKSRALCTSSPLRVDRRTFLPPPESSVTPACLSGRPSAVNTLYTRRQVHVWIPFSLALPFVSHFPLFSALSLPLSPFASLSTSLDFLFSLYQTVLSCSLCV